jgi:trans-2-enoyl-CoA reductase
MEAKVVEFVAVGEPRDVIRVVTRSVEVTAEKPILIRMLYCPINPADGLRIRGKFGFHEELPAVLGGEGVGVIEQLHDSYAVNENTFAVGDVCILPFGGTWSSWKAVAPGELIKTMSDIDSKQLCLFGINAATGVLLLQMSGLKTGDWMIQNAANSAVGKLLIVFAKRQGIKTVNVVRREDVVEELVTLGGDVVLIDGPDLKERVLSLCNGAHIRVGFDAVAGTASGRLVDTLCFGGRLLVYGLMSDPSIIVPANRIAFNGVTVGGFSRMGVLRHMMRNPSEVYRLFNELAQWHKEGVFKFDISNVFSVDDVVTAFEESEKPKLGKVVLQFN